VNLDSAIESTVDDSNNASIPPRGVRPGFLPPGARSRCDISSFLANSGLPKPLFSYTLVIISRWENCNTQTFRVGKMCGSACRQALKLQWWNVGESQVFDLDVHRIGETSFWGVVVEEGYGVATGYRVIFGKAEPYDTLWILSIMTFDELITAILLDYHEHNINY
jgi:hypothetical protein